MLKEGRKNLASRLAPHLYIAKTLNEIQVQTSKRRKFDFESALKLEPNLQNRSKLKVLNTERERWISGKTTKDQRRKQRYFEELADRVWKELPRDSYIEIRDLAAAMQASTRNLYRILSVLAGHGLIEMKDLNRQTNSKHAKSFDLKRKAEVIIPLVYVKERESKISIKGRQPNSTARPV